MATAYQFTASNPPTFSGVVVRKHHSNCPYPVAGNRRDCKCPKWIYVTPGRVRIPANTDSWVEAEQRGYAWVREHDPRIEHEKKITPKRIDEAFEDYLKTKEGSGLKRPTLSKIRTIRKQLLAFVEQWNHEHPSKTLTYIHEVKLEHLKEFMQSWDDNMPLEHGRKVVMSGKSKQKRIGYLRELFDHCLQAEWIENTGETIPKGKYAIPKSNPANFLQSTGRGSKAEDKMPLSDKLYAAILEACLSYESKLKTRNRAAIAGIGQRTRLLCELMYNTGFSITDAVTTGRSRLKTAGKDYYFDVQRRKLEGSPASKHIWMKVDREFAKRLLAMKPSPDTDPKYFFWSGIGEVDNAADSWWKAFPRIRALVDAKLMRNEMGVDDEGETIQPTFHCFRYSFAQNLFWAGADVPDVAKYLGDTPAIVAKHYWKFSKKLQQKGERLLDKVINKRKKR